ncbi:MAG TPA: hypothetical protein VNQ77_10005 [Frankiaceae bacterium]|nr:hypothetical protein [Frankiaceae bacterium]
MTPNDPLAGLHGPRRTAPPGGADRVITAGRRRLHRRRTAGTAAGLSVAVVGGTFVVSGGSGDPNSLTPAAPTSLPATTVTGVPSPVPPNALPSRGQRTPAEASPEQPTPEPSEYQGEGPPTVEPQPEPAPGSPSRQWVGVVPPEPRVAHGNDPAACSDPEANKAPTTGFCTILHGPKEVTPGSVVSLAFSLCRLPGVPAKDVTFESQYESTLKVSALTGDENREVWAWAHPEDFAPDRHTVRFEPGDCREWSVEWAGQDASGYALEPGSYEVLGAADAWEWTHEDGPDAQGPPPAYYLIEVR